MADDTPRRYESVRRARMAQQTRTAIAEAARTQFLSRGWAATTVRDIAEEAGVSVPTVYSTYGGKAGLAIALADSADLAAGADGVLELLEASDANPRRQLAAMARYDRGLYEHSGDLIRLVRDAHQTEPELADVYAKRRLLADEIRLKVFTSWPSGSLRPELTPHEAADIYSALCNIDVFATLVDERGWAPGRVEQWWSDVLARELLADV